MNAGLDKNRQKLPKKVRVFGNFVFVNLRAVANSDWNRNLEVIYLPNNFSFKSRGGYLQIFASSCGGAVAEVVAVVVPVCGFRFSIWKR